MIRDEKWPVARLIPITSSSGVEAQERRAASALLAVIAGVPEFGHALLKPLGAPSGRIETFIEVPFKMGDRSLRPDGIISVTRGSRSWQALLEMKTGSNAVERDQMELYLDLARELKFDALLSISNQYVTSSSEHPVQLDKRKTGKVIVRHWSWIDVLTEAIVQKRHRGVGDPDQAYILGELIRYLSDPRSGAVAFDNMGSAWTAVREGARDRTLHRGDAAVDVLVRRWDELVRYLCLELTKDLGRDVSQSLPSAERSASTRLQALKDSLVGRGELHAELRIPDAVGPMSVIANLAARQVTASARLSAPEEGRSKGRVSWLLRQLPDAPPTVTIQARAARASSVRATTLAKAREDPTLLFPDEGRDIKEFVLGLTRDMGLKRDAGRGSFIHSVLETVKDFYASVLQELSAWKPRAPKLVPQPEEAVAEEISVALPEQVAAALEVAEREMQELAEDREDSTTRVVEED